MNGEITSSNMENEASYVNDPEEIVINKDNVEAIKRWLDLKSSWGSGKPLEDYAAFAPDNITKDDLRATFLTMKSRGSNVDYDTRGYYITALADKLLEEEFKQKYPNGATPEEEKRFWEEEARIELDRPETDQYGSFRKFGTYWRRGTLVLRGDFGRDTNIGYGMSGGKIHIIGDAGKNLGLGMTGGVIEVDGYANLGYRDPNQTTKGEIYVHGNPVSYSTPKIREEPIKPVLEQAQELIPEAVAKSGEDMEGAADIEADIRQIMALINEEVLPDSIPIDHPKGWFVGYREPNYPSYKDPSIKSKAVIGYYDGTESSYRTPTVKMEITTYKDQGVRIVVNDWRKSEKVEDHPFNNRGKARKGMFYSARINNGITRYPRAGDFIDDAEDFPREENLATQEGFGQAQMYALRDIVKEASISLKLTGEF